jgi:hypothetical protein
MDLNTKKLFSRHFGQRLQILTDLSPKDVQALHEISGELPLTVHPSTRTSLKRDNLIVSEGKGFKLTLLGETVYKRALDLLSHDWSPGRYLDAEQIRLLKGKAPVSVASRIRKYLGIQVENGAVKLAIFLGSGPQAYRQLSRCWDVDLTSNDLVGIVGEPTHPDRAVRGELIGLTEKGIDLLTRVIPYLSI